MRTTLLKVTRDQLELLVGILGDEITRPAPTNLVGKQAREELTLIALQADRQLTALNKPT